MSDADKNDNQKSKPDGDITLDLNFVPQWARRPPDEVRFARFDDDDRSARRGGRGRHGSRQDQRGDRRARRPDEASRKRPSRPGGKDTRPGADAAGRRDRGGSERPPRDSRSGAPRPMQRSGRQGPPPEVLPLNVRFLPEQKALNDLIRRLSASKRAYPLLDLAAMLMSKEGLCYVKLDVQPEARDFRLFQCKHCGTLARSRDLIESHVSEVHMDLIFDIEEEQVAPPAGVFVCVAKCGYSGELLGPPNHHRYAEAVKRLHAERFSNMDLETYKRHIETSHDEADVERWKEQASKRVVYRLKGKRSDDGEKAEGMSWVDAHRHMTTEVAPKSIDSSRRVALSEKAAHGIQDPAIRGMLRNEWQQESRFPIHLAFALRAAFRHRGLHLFKTSGGRGGKGMHFVTAVKTVPLDPETAIPAIRDALLFMQEHPGCTRKDMVEALRPGAAPDSDEVKALLQPIHWLVEKGHVIEFFNGTLSVPK